MLNPNPSFEKEVKKKIKIKKKIKKKLGSKLCKSDSEHTVNIHLNIILLASFSQF